MKINLLRTTKEYIENLKNKGELTKEKVDELKTKIKFYGLPMSWETKLLKKLK